MKNEVYVCSECGRDCLVVNAYANWSIQKQCFVLGELSEDKDWCDECEEVIGIFIPVSLYDIFESNDPGSLEQLLDKLPSGPFSRRTYDDKSRLHDLIINVIRRKAEEMEMDRNALEEKLGLAKVVASL